MLAYSFERSISPSASCNARSISAAADVAVASDFSGTGAGASPTRGAPLLEVYGAGAASAAYLWSTILPDVPLKSMEGNPNMLPGAARDVLATAISDPKHTVNTPYLAFRMAPHTPSWRLVLRPDTSGVASSARAGPGTDAIVLNAGTQQRGRVLARRRLAVRGTSEYFSAQENKSSNTQAVQHR